MSYAPVVAEDHVVVRILQYEHHYSLFLDDASIIAIPYKFGPAPELGERLSVLRNQEYGFVTSIRMAGRNIDFL